MQQQNIPIGTLVDMYKRGELRLPEIQRHYVWRATRVRDLLDSLYRGYPSGSILMWETDEPVPTRDFAIAQETNAFAGRKLLLDGQQRLTSLTAVLSGTPVQVRGRKRPIDILFNLDHPEGPPSYDTEVTGDEDSPTAADDELTDDPDEGDEGTGVDDGEAGDSALQAKLNRRTFVVASKNLAALPNWVSVTEVFGTANDAQLLKKAGITSFDDPRFQQYSDRLKKLRAIKDYPYVVHVLERRMSYEDDSAYAPRAIQGFYKKDELMLMAQRRSSRKKLGEEPIDSRIVERYYQTRAIRRVGASFETDRQRKALLVMATGSGKTRTVIALADLLMRCNWAKRVLFLADRVALVNQAVNAFKAHLPDSAPVNLVTDKATEGRVFVSTYPTMMGLIDETFDGQRRFGVGHFDLIVIDEAHRSVYQKYEAIFRYFDSLLVGLTATPKDEVDRNTYGLFELEDGVPTDAYDLDQAVADGHLVPPVAISVPLKFQREGIRYADLSEEEKAQWDELDWNEDGTAPDVVTAEELNKWLFNVDTVDKVLEVLMTKGHKVAGGDRLGKTIIFAKNSPHAEFIEQRFNANYPEYKGHFARVVTYKTEYAQSIIDDFSNKEKMPHIAVSVDMLDTGIDVPEVVNLVFFKLVRSKTKFWQMLGRGTRLCKDLFGPGEDKKNFFVFDFCQNLEYFSQNPAGGEGTTAESLTTRLFKCRLELIGELDARSKQENVAGEQPPSPYGGHPTLEEMRKATATLLQERVAAMNVDNFVVRPHRQAVEHYALPEAWQVLQPDDVDTLSHRIASLPSQRTDDDEEAKRFDMLVLRAQLAILQARPDFLSLRQKIQAIAVNLEDEMAIPAIKAEATLIHAVASDEWWQDVTVPMLETARRRLRALVKLLPKGQKKVVYTDFEDEVGEGAVIDLPQVTAGLNMAKFKEKARAFLRQHESHLALQRLRRNQALTPTDLEELERMLVEAGGTQPLMAEVKSLGLGLFIRSLVGLDREAAMQAFSELLQGSTATPEQIEFIELVVQELTQNGVVPPERLFEPPFTDISSHGPTAVFAPAQVTRIVDVLRDISARAVA